MPEWPQVGIGRVDDISVVGRTSWVANVGILSLTSFAIRGPAQVAKLLQVGLRGDKEAASQRALELRSEGTSLREIGIRLAAEGILPRDGGLWHPAQVRALLVGEESVGVGE